MRPGEIPTYKYKIGDRVLGWVVELKDYREGLVLDIVRLERPCEGWNATWPGYVVEIEVGKRVLEQSQVVKIGD